MTLAFIGSVGDDLADAAVAAAGAAAGEGHTFRVDLDALGLYPERGPVRVVWAGASGAAGAIAALGGGVRDQLARRRVPFDPKPLRPHVTLARVHDDATGEDARAVASAVASLAMPDGLGFDADAIEVVESVLSRGGPRYSARARLELGAPSGGGLDVGG